MDPIEFLNQEKMRSIVRKIIVDKIMNSEAGYNKFQLDIWYDISEKEVARTLRSTHYAVLKPSRFNCI